jgi:hypothetical protein
VLIFDEVAVAGEVAVVVGTMQAVESCSNKQTAWPYAVLQPFWLHREKLGVAVTSNFVPWSPVCYRVGCRLPAVSRVQCTRVVFT